MAASLPRLVTWSLTEGQKSNRPREREGDNQGNASTCTIYGLSKAVSECFKDYPEISLPPFALQRVILDSAYKQEEIDKIRNDGANLEELIGLVNEILARSKGITANMETDEPAIKMDFRIGCLADWADAGDESKQARLLDLAKKYERNGQLKRCVICGHRIYTAKEKEVDVTKHGRHAMQGQSVDGSHVVCNNSWGKSHATIDVGDAGSFYPNLTGVIHIMLYNVKNAGRYQGPQGGGVSYGFQRDVFESGQVYEGQYRDSKAHGRGTFKWPDGKVYEGLFENGKKHGRGTLKDGHGSVLQQGTWKHDEFVPPEGCRIG